MSKNLSYFDLLQYQNKNANDKFNSILSISYLEENCKCEENVTQICEIVDCSKPEAPIICPEKCETFEGMI